MLLRKWILAVAIALSCAAWGQVDYGVEQWLQEEGSESTAADWSDRLAELQASPVNINDTAALAQLPFLTPFHHQALKNYIRLYGELLSVKELALVPGFDSSLLTLIAPLVRVGAVPQKERWRWWEGRHTLTLGLGATVEQAAGYANGHYEGDNHHALMAYQYNYRDRLQVGFAADKDPAEAWGRGNFYNYHLMLGNVGRLAKAAVGRYSLQFGQGLTLWTGFQPFDITGLSPERYGAGIKRAGTFNEEDYLEGAAATIRLWRGLSATGFASRTTGATLAGGHAEWRHGNIVLGTTLTHTALSDSLNPRELAYNRNAFRGDRLGNLGVDALWQTGGLLLYGEAGVDHEGHMAAIGGLRLRLGSNRMLGICLRHYGSEYHNLHSQPYSTGNGQGEQGVRLDLQSGLPLGLKGRFSADLHRFPTLRYANYRPSEGARLRVQIDKSLSSHLSASLRYTYRQKSRNVPYLDSAVYAGEYTCWQQLQAEAKAEWERWTLTAKGGLAMFGSESSSLQRGALAALTARYNHGHWQAGAALAYFNTDGYYTRFYLNENNIQYAWSMPALYGKGLRTYLLVRYTVSSHIAIVGKYALTAHPGQESTGSGDAQTDGPLRQTWHLQIRWHF